MLLNIVFKRAQTLIILTFIFKFINIIFIIKKIDIISMNTIYIISVQIKMMQIKKIAKIAMIIMIMMIIIVKVVKNIIEKKKIRIQIN